MKKHISKLKLLLASIFISTLSSLVHAQVSVITGGNSFASECYSASINAAQGWGGSFSDIENCDEALRTGNLNTRDSVATYVNRGIIYAALDNIDRAVNDYDQALKLRDDLPETYLNRGNLWFMAERYQDAISDYNKALQLDLRQKHILYLNRGMVYELMGSLDQAESDYLTALEIVPEWKPALSKLERVHSKQ